jgi:hypothetical protein
LQFELEGFKIKTIMKQKLIFFLLLVVGFGIFLVIKFLLMDKQNEIGVVRVVASPVASVFIDNVAVGKTPYEGKYKVGEYLLKLIPEGTATETASWQGKITINKNALTYINRELGMSDITSAGEIFTVFKMEKPPKNASYGEISVESEPQGAIVYLDNDEKGVAPLILTDVLKGDHELSVSMPGFFRRNQKVNVDGGYRVKAQIKLALDQSYKRLEDELKASDSAQLSNQEKPQGKITIKDTPTGWLRVREEPSLNASESARVKPGEQYDFLEEKEGWYKIKLSATASGWVSAQYSEK